MNGSKFPNDGGSSDPDNTCNEPTNQSEEPSESNDLEEQTQEQNSGSDEEGKKNLEALSEGNKEDVDQAGPSTEIDQVDPSTETDQAGPSTEIDQAGPSTEINQAGPSTEIGSSDSKGAIIHMERAMSQFRHCGLQNLLETQLGELAEKIRQSTLRLVNDPTTRRYIPFVLSPLVELGVYNIVFPNRGIPYFFVRPKNQHNEQGSGAENSCSEHARQEESQQYEGIVEIGRANHLPSQIDCFGELVVPRDYSERSYIHMQGGFPLDIPPGTDMRIDPSADITPPTELQKKMPLLSDLLDLNKPPTLEMNDPILTAMLTTPTLDYEDCVGLVKHLSITKDTSIALKILRQQNPSLARAWALEEDELNRILIQQGKAETRGVTNYARSEILNKLLEWLKENQPSLYSAWKDTNAFSNHADLPMTSWVERCNKQIPRNPVELLVYNLHATETTTPPPDDESPELSSADEQDQSEPQQGGSAESAAEVQQQQQEPVAHSDDSQEEHDEQVGHIDDSQEEEESSEQVVINEDVANHNDQMEVDLPMDNVGGLADRSLKAQIEFMGQLPPASVNILVEPNIWFKERITAAIFHEPGSDVAGKQISHQTDPTSVPEENDQPMDLRQPSTSGTSTAHGSTTEASPDRTQTNPTATQIPITEPQPTATQTPTTEPQDAAANESPSRSTRVVLHPITLALLNSPPAEEVLHSPSCPAATQAIQGSSETPSENPGCSCAMKPPSDLSPTKRKRIDSATTTQCQENPGSSTGSSPVGNPPSPTKKFRRQSPRLIELRAKQGSSSGSSPSNDPSSPLQQLHLSTSKDSQSQVSPNTSPGQVPIETPIRMDVEISQTSPCPLPEGGRPSRSLKRKGGDPNPEAGPSREKQQASHASPEVRKTLQESILERRLLYGSTVNSEQPGATQLGTEGSQTEEVIDLTETTVEHLRQRQESERSEGAEVVQNYGTLIQLLSAPPKPREESQEKSTRDENPEGAPEE